VLVSISIFLVISVAMMGIFASASRIYSEGEKLRMASDEAMLVMNMLNRDIDRAELSGESGTFYAELQADNGNCAVGWRMNDGTRSVFVLWRIESDNLVRRIIEMDTLTLSRLRSASPGTVSTISPQCLHFGCRLGGTEYSSAPLLGAHYDYWRHDAQNNPSDPSRANPLYTNIEPSIDSASNEYYPRDPSAIRFTLVLTDGGTLRKGRLRRIDSNTAEVVGVINPPSGPMSFMRLRSGTSAEWVGYHRVDGNRYSLNSTLWHGPLGEKNTGRGVLGSAEQNFSNANPEVFFGSYYVFTRHLGQ
jgi:hypothetical protein